MLLRTLGELRLEGGALTRPKPLLLLAYLALEGPQPRRHLAEFFWPTSGDPMKRLTVALARVREKAADAIETDHRQARVRVPSDAERFQACVETGRFDAALEHYRGPFLDGVYLKNGGVELEEWIFGTREYLAALARRAKLGLAERAAEQEEHERAARYAEEAYGLAGAPAADPADLARMHTLLLAGGSVRAAEVHKEAADFGVPLAASQEAARAQLRDALGASRTTSALPTRGTTFVGRDMELLETARLLADAEVSLLTLVGPGGVGKTRLGLQVAREQDRLGSFADGVRFVALDALAAAEGLPHSLAEGLDVDLNGGGATIAKVAKGVGDRRLLVLLDNFEHVIDGALQLSDLLGRCPNLKLLVTSRMRLNLEEEHILAINGLPFPDDPAVTAVEAERFDAVALFVNRAKRARPDFVLGEAETPHVLRICRLVEGLPLGLELAAVWVKLLPPEDIAREITAGLDLLATDTRNVPARQRSVRSAFEHSWRLLTPKEQEVLARLSVFRGGFRREAANPVAGATIPVLGSLVDKSLLRVGREGRYALHPLVQQFCGEKLVLAGALSATQDAHGRFFFAYLHEREADIDGERLARALRAIDDDWENIRSTFAWIVARGDAAGLRRCIDAVELCFERRGLLSEGLALLEHLATTLDETDPERRLLLGRCLVESAWYHYRMTHHNDAEAQARRGVALLAALDDHWESKGHNTLGCLALELGDYPAGEAHIEEALRVARRHGDQLSQIALLGNLAIAANHLGHYRQAESHAREALGLSRELGKVYKSVFALRVLGDARLALGHPAEAEALWREGVALARSVGDKNNLPNLLLGLSEVARARADHRAARTSAEEALGLARDSGRQGLEGQALTQLAKIAGPDDARRAGALCLDALELAWASGDTPNVLSTLRVWADLETGRGEPEAAAELLQLVLRDDHASNTVVEAARASLDDLRRRLERRAFAQATDRAGATTLSEAVAAVLAGRAGNTSPTAR